jgi:flagellar basal-body rod protein FlgB
MCVEGLSRAFFQEDAAVFADDRMQDLAKLMDVSSLKARVHMANIANQNTPYYRAKRGAFDQAFTQALRRGDAAEARRVEPEIIEAGGGSVDNDGNNVNVTQEITEAKKNAMLYNTYVSLMRGKGRMLSTAISGGNGGG